MSIQEPHVKALRTFPARIVRRALWSRGYEVLQPGPSPLRQILARHQPVVVRKPAARA